MQVTVYCGAALGHDEKYQRIAKELAEWIAGEGHVLVYGGGNVGLMGMLADHVLARGGQVIGVMPEFLVGRELAHPGLTRLEIVHTMHERKMKMIEFGDVYIALPGGPGTLEEITEVISWGRIGQHTHPCIFMNQTGFYEDLKQQYTKMVQEGFLTHADFEKILFAEDIGEIEPFIETYTPCAVREYK